MSEQNQPFLPRLPVMRSITGALVPIKPHSYIAEFLDKCRFKAETGCWVWLGKVTHGRSPQFMAFGRSMSALKASWELFVGNPGRGGKIYRNCGNKLCVNPFHLSHRGERPAAGQGRRRSTLKKLNNDAIFEIRTSLESRPALARKFGVSEWTIWAVRKGVRGSSVPFQPGADPQAIKAAEEAAFMERTMDMLKELNRRDK